MPELSSEVVKERYRSGELFNDIFAYSNFESRDNLLQICVQLHNCKEIDLLALTNLDSLSRIEQRNFFPGQHFFCQAIPRLEATLDAMMNGVKALVEKGGADLASNQPNAAFLEWCAKDLDRAKEVVERSRSGDELASDHATYALIAGGYIEDAIFFMANFDDARRLSGVASLGRMKFSDQDSANRAINALLHLVRESKEDSVLANALHAAFDIRAKYPSIESGIIHELISEICLTSGIHTQHACARVIFSYSKTLTARELKELFSPLSSLDSAHRGIIESLDIALSNLLKTEHARCAVEFVTALFLSSDSFSMREFDSFSYTLLEIPIEFENAVLTWLLLGNKSLCEGINQVVGSGDVSGPAVTFNLQNFDLSEIQKMFIARKSVGYFFNKPVLAASIIVSILRVSEGDLKDGLVTLLFDSILRSYSGDVRKYLTGVESDDKAYSAVQTAIERLETYMDAVRSVGEIREIQPTELRRRIIRQKDRDEMRVAHKEAMDQSQLLKLVHRSVILHGKKTLSFVAGPGGSRSPVEMSLGSHHFSFEVPRIGITDPVGLDYMIRVFRTERIRS